VTGKSRCGRSAYWVPDIDLPAPKKPARQFAVRK